MKSSGLGVLLLWIAVSHAAVVPSATAGGVYLDAEGGARKYTGDPMKFFGTGAEFGLAASMTASPYVMLTAGLRYVDHGTAERDGYYTFEHAGYYYYYSLSEVALNFRSAALGMRVTLRDFDSDRWVPYIGGAIGRERRTLRPHSEGRDDEHFIDDEWVPQGELGLRWRVTPRFLGFVGARIVINGFGDDWSEFFEPHDHDVAVEPFAGVSIRL